MSPRDFGFGGGGVAGENTGRAIGQAQAGNAKARDARDITSLALIDGGVLAAVVNEGKFLGQGHLRQERIGTRVSRDGGWRGLRMG